MDPLKLPGMHGAQINPLVEHGIETDVNKRWETGMPHHPKSEELMKFLMAVDIELVDDYFCWKKGGDGDNGEQLMYELDMWFELQDKLNPKE